MGPNGRHLPTSLFQSAACSSPVPSTAPWWPPTHPLCTSCLFLPEFNGCPCLVKARAVSGPGVAPRHRGRVAGALGPAGPQQTPVPLQAGPFSSEPSEDWQVPGGQGALCFLKSLLACPCFCLKGNVSRTRGPRRGGLRVPWGPLLRRKALES